MTWDYTQSVSPDGFGLFFVHVWDREGKEPLNVTFFRDVPTMVQSFTFADPFGAASAQILFPQCTGFDGPSGDTWWLRENVNVDITWVPASVTQWHADEVLIINPLTQQRNLYLHERMQDGSVRPHTWEGFFVSLDPSVEGVSITCQGALYQLDRYYAKPVAPIKPRSVEGVIARYFDRRRRGIFTRDLVIPELSDPTWHKVWTDADQERAETLGFRYYPVDLTNAQYDGWINPNSGANVVNHRWTGYMTRFHGSWEKILTGYIQGQLSYMYVTPETTVPVSFAASYSNRTIVFTVPAGNTIPAGTRVTVTRCGKPYNGTWTVTGGTDTTVTCATAKNLGAHSGFVSGTMIYADGVGNPNYSRGDQWTITMDSGRVPRMYVRKQKAAPTLVAWYGQPGVEATLTRDGNQVSNVFFGTGKGANAAGDLMWTRQTQPGLAPWSVFRPIATARNDVYHFWEQIPGEPEPTPAPWPVRGPTHPNIQDLPEGYDAQYERENGIWLSEKMVQFPDGIDEGTAVEIAQNWVAVDQDPGWTGTIALMVDLKDPNGVIRSKWTIKEGDVLHLKGFYGSGGAQVRGTNIFHVTQVQASVPEGRVELTVDTKFRDLMSVEEAIARGRDTLVPVKSLQVGKRSAMVDDMIVPWNNREGSGMIPRQSRAVFFDDAFPHVDVDGTKGSTIDHPPVEAGHQMFTSAYRGMGKGIPVGKESAMDFWLEEVRANGPRASASIPPLYIPVNAGSSDKNRRWAMVPILLSQAGKIIRTEIAAYDADGRLAPVEFHVSFYDHPSLDIGSMPMDPVDWNKTPPDPKGTPHSALWNGAFENWNMVDGFFYADVSAHTPNAKMIIGWGNYDQPAGYSPKRRILGAAGDAPTGMLIDSSPWEYNFFGDPNSVSFPYTNPGYNMKEERQQVGVSVTMAIYAQIPSYITGAAREALNWVYFRGRLYRGIE